MLFLSLRISWTNIQRKAKDDAESEDIGVAMANIKTTIMMTSTDVRHAKQIYEYFKRGSTRKLTIMVCKDQAEGITKEELHSYFHQQEM